MLVQMFPDRVAGVDGKQFGNGIEGQRWGKCVLNRLNREALAVRATISELIAMRSTPDSPGLDRLILALVAGEDGRFYTHPGFDTLAIVSALIGWLTGHPLRGASTIDQQLVRTVRRRYELTVERKLSEIYIAARVCRAFSKRDLAIAYLESAYFGWRGTGLQQLARRLDLTIETIGLEESTYVVALLKFPLPRFPNEARLRRINDRARYIEKRLTGAHRIKLGGGVA